jgi:hypothetical protein
VLNALPPAGPRCCASRRSRYFPRFGTAECPGFPTRGRGGPGFGGGAAGIRNFGKLRDSENGMLVDRGCWKLGLRMAFVIVAQCR